MADSTFTPIFTNPKASSPNPFKDPSSPFFLHHAENHSPVIVSPELTSMNFASWKRSFLLVVSIRNKQVSISKPAPKDPLYLPWIRCNNLMVAWLLRSISAPISSTVFYMEEANLNGIWEELRNFRPHPHCACGKCNPSCFQVFIDIQQKDYNFNESAAMAVRRSKSELYCIKYGKNGHLKEKCYKLICFPPGFKFTKGKNATIGNAQSCANQVIA
ncbi:hypothetical protein RCOM_0857110 [Ricinus communis]|uniref:Retrotransposon Copia-like N-terminal domain-containing protein n=1 Tax=Ricinus communis TaxID=3988 RepID=B9SUJ8_RICCO|nr:hypothetical protein RCOM_0857110 [Ricinus communis]